MTENEYQLKNGLNIHAVCQKAIYTYGAVHQKIKAIEELGELVEAIERYIEELPNNVEEETADVEIMMCQLRKMYQVPDDSVFLNDWTLQHNLNILVIQLGKLISALARSINGEEHTVEKSILLVERAMKRVKYAFDEKLIDEIKLQKLERLANHIW